MMVFFALQMSFRLQAKCFFIPEYRKSNELNYLTCILNTIYKAFDNFHFSVNFSTLPIDFLLAALIQYIFTAIPPNHWLHTRRLIPAYAFFFYSREDHRLTLLSPSQYTSQYFPRFLNQFLLSIYLSHTNPHLTSPWLYYIATQSNETYEPSHAALLSQVTTSSLCFQFRSHVYRQSDSSTISPLVCLFLPDICGIACFVRSYPSAFIYIKSIAVPFLLAPYISLYNIEIRAHFLFECPRKRVIWTSTFGPIYPWLTFTNEQIANTLLYPHIPYIIPKSHQRKDLSLVNVIQYTIWKSYWQYIFNNIPFLPDFILHNIHRTYRTLV
ncbi:MAG: hypothetical protein EXX96DRAFT_543236 [Benjaminiella poitrasii]|nr:MAG: hypothetical protein EXX96DRAFT_543236 [Benjaminiella poitrasii]